MKQRQRLMIRSAQVDQQQIHLTAEQWHYLTRVLRLGRGDRFIAIIQANWWEAQLTEVQQAICLAPVPIQTELPQPVTLMAAPPKGNGFDEVIRQATELGVSRIVPVLSDRTLLQPSAARQQRWQRIATEATEQCQRQVVPEVWTPQAFLPALELSQQWQDAPDLQLIGVTDRMAPQLWTYLSPGSTTSTVMLTGPEGGWTDAEVEAALQQGYQPISLGPRTLRAVTAPLVALSLIAAQLESAQPHVVSTDD